MGYKDIYSDNSLRVLNRILKAESSLVDTVKTASQDMGDESTLPSTAFADERNRRFPVHTSELAKLSYYYAVEQNAPQDILTKIAEAIDETIITLNILQEQ